MSTRVAGRHILISGGGTGIGRASAIRCSNEGAIVTVLGRTRGPLEEVAAITGGYAITANLSDEDEVVRAVADAAARMGAIDGLINCVGKPDAGGLDNTGLAQWEMGLKTNLTAPYLICRAALPYLRQSKNAAIVNVAALAAIRPGVSSIAYAAAKAGLVQFSKMIAAELAPAIRVNSVCPGAVETEMLARILDTYSESRRSFFLERYAQKRLASPDEIANLLLFLVSSEASYVTGSNYVADGGRAYY